MKIRQQKHILHQVYDFHGHVCLMSTAGVRLARAAMSAIGIKKQQDFLFAFYHAKTCAADAIQFITGCTLGNGNIIINDEKKHILELVREDNGKGVKVTLRDKALKKMRNCMKLKKEYEKQSDKKSPQKAKLKYKDDFEDMLYMLQNDDDKSLLNIKPITIDLNKRIA